MKCLNILQLCPNEFYSMLKIQIKMKLIEAKYFDYYKLNLLEVFIYVSV